MQRKKSDFFQEQASALKDMSWAKRFYSRKSVFRGEPEATSRLRLPAKREFVLDAPGMPPAVMI